MRSNSPVPAYDTSAMAALDEALVKAMERAHAAEEDTLAHFLVIDRYDPQWTERPLRQFCVRVNDPFISL